MKYVLLVINILVAIAIIFLERKSPTEALLWVLIVLLIPYVGIIIYLIFGSTLSIKLTSYFRKKRLQKYYPNVTKPDKSSVENIGIDPEDLEVVNFNLSYNNSRITSYDDAKVYTDGMSHYNQLFEDIKNAKDCIFVEFYTIHHDKVGEAFVNALAEKAKEGVKVLVMCDFVANFNVPARMFRPLKKAGGKVVRVKPYLTHYRSHRKIVCIDHEISYIGGMNIGEKYINRSKKKNPWRDTQVRLTGSSALILDEYFLTDWLCSVRRKYFNKTIKYIDSIPDRENKLNHNLCQFIVGGADTNKESVKMCYLSLIRSAKKSIRIQSPYFIPDASILDALKTAQASGVQVELMIPGIKSSFFLDPVTTYYSGQLLEFGAKIHKYNGYIHAKTIIIDDELCCIGSVNMDIRSLKVDDEITGVFYENNFVNKYYETYNNDILNSKDYTYEEFKNRGQWEKFIEGFWILFSPVM